MNIKEYESMAKLSLSEDEREWVTEKADALVKGFALLEEVDTANVEPLFTVLDITNVTREDVARKEISRDELLANAPEQYDGCFQAPSAMRA